MPKILPVAFLALTTVMAGCRENDTRAFTVVMLPDTQNYAAHFPGIFYEHLDWVRDNVTRENIVFVTQVGDLVYGGGGDQWQVASNAMARLDGVVPWGVAVGNHDYDDNVTRSTPTFARLFGPQRFAGLPWYGGGTEDGKCSYQFFLGAGRTYMILHLPFEAGDDALAWARKVIETHAGVPTIVSTHWYLTPTPSGPTPFVGGEAPGRNGPAAIKRKLIDKHPQIFLVLCGHISVDAPMYCTNTNDAGGTVLSLLANFQGGQWGGNGYLLLLKFDPPSNRIIVRVYSTRLKADLPGPQGNFTIACPIQLTTAGMARGTVDPPPASRPGVTRGD
jgi:hypothetical protein